MTDIEQLKHRVKTNDKERKGNEGDMKNSSAENKLYIDYKIQITNSIAKQWHVQTIEHGP
jgi:hypothetical protein